jgi:hypothetical protein
MTPLRRLAGITEGVDDSNGALVVLVECTPSCVDKLVPLHVCAGSLVSLRGGRDFLVSIMTDFDMPKVSGVHASMVRMLFPRLVAPAGLLPPTRCSEASEWRFAANSASIANHNAKEGPLEKKQGRARHPIRSETL